MGAGSRPRLSAVRMGLSRPEAQIYGHSRTSVGDPPGNGVQLVAWWSGSEQSDTPQGLKPHGFSVHPRRHPRESPKALSAP